MRPPRTAILLSIPLAAMVAGAWVAPAGADVTDPSAGGNVTAASHRNPDAPDSVSLEQCVSSPEQEERAATFAGEMTALPGTTRMEMRVDLLERGTEEESYRRVTAPGLSVWRSSLPGVKSFRYLKQVTNLTAPASYRGLVSFRWLNSHGRLISTAELRTRPCEQTVVAAPSPAPGATLN
jgi:hypothetical protein